MCLRTPARYVCACIEEKKMQRQTREQSTTQTGAEIFQFKFETIEEHVSQAPPKEKTTPHSK